MAEGQRSRSEIAAAILSKLAAGALPNVRVEKVWAGRGSGRPCYGCDGLIGASEIEVEIDLAGALALRLHQRCFEIWQGALEKSERPSGGDETASA